MAVFSHSDAIEQPAPIYTDANAATHGDGIGAEAPEVLPSFIFVNDFAHQRVQAFVAPTVIAVGKTLGGRENVEATPGRDWFETFHVIPRSFDFPQLLTSQSVPIEVYNAHRDSAEEWTSFTNNAGAGTVLTGQPSLPTSVHQQNGVAMTLDVDTIGPAFVDTTLDFFFTGLGTAFVPITIQRLSLFAPEPENGYDETLEFLTDIHESDDGTEKRYRIRRYPRQRFDLSYILEEGPEASEVENILFDFHDQSLGVPVWREESRLTADVAVSATTITVDSTAYRDYRVNGFLVIYQDASTFEVLQIQSLTSTTITLVTPTTLAFLAADYVRVMPIHASILPRQLSGERYIVGARQIELPFTVLDNVADLEDASAFGTFNGCPYIDLPNSVFSATKEFDLRHEFFERDGGAGRPYRASGWDREKRGHPIGWHAEGLQEVWELRGLLHYLGGRWQPFYVPTWGEDLLVVADAVSGTNTLDVQNVGYGQFVQHRQAKNAIRVVFNDGTADQLYNVTGSSFARGVDVLVLDQNWPATYTPAQIERVEYVERVRFDSDDIRIRYSRGGLHAHVLAPVLTLFDG